jgi:hypothetical protein
MFFLLLKPDRCLDYFIFLRKRCLDGFVLGVIADPIIQMDGFNDEEWTCS